MAKKKIYIAGKITGLPLAIAQEKFKEAQKHWESFGYKVINPMELTHEHDRSWNSYMKECIKNLMECDLIFTLENWENSKGALIEESIASKVGIERIYK